MIFAECHIADVVLAIFDAPMPAPPVEQSTGRGQRARHAGNGVFHLNDLFALALGSPNQAADLGRLGPIEIACQARGRLQAACHAAAVFFAACFRNVKVRLAFPLVCRGKKPP